MKLTGFRASHRNRWLLVRDRFLSLQLLSLYEYYLDQNDFDGTHEKFGVFEVYFDEIARIFHRSIETIRDWHNALLEKRLITVFDSKRKLYAICNPQRYGLAKSKKGDAYFYAGVEKIIHSVELLFPFIQFPPQTKENIPDNCDFDILDNSPKALVSFKEKSNLSPVPNSNTKGVDSYMDEGASHQDIADVFFQHSLFDYFNHLKKGGGS